MVLVVIKQQWNFFLTIKRTDRCLKIIKNFDYVILFYLLWFYTVKFKKI